MKDRKGLWAALVVVVAIAAFLVYVATQAIGQVTGFQNQNNSAAGVDTSSWATYTNAQYGFSLQYPPNWDVFTNGLDAVTPFIAIGNPLNGTSTYVMDIFVEPNPQSLSSAEYVHQLLNADRAQDASTTAAGPAPSVTPQFRASYLVTLNGTGGYELFDVFEFDHNAERIYVANGTTALHFDFPVADANPNIASPANNNAIAHLILGTLTFN